MPPAASVKTRSTDTARSVKQEKSSPNWFIGWQPSAAAGLGAPQASAPQPRHSEDVVARPQDAQKTMTAIQALPRSSGGLLPSSSGSWRARSISGSSRLAPAAILDLVQPAEPHAVEHRKEMMVRFALDLLAEHSRRSLPQSPQSPQSPVGRGQT